jgi:hypothetical protein
MPYDIPAPMLAKSVPTVPDPAKTPGGLSFEPKWDGFRALISWDGEAVEIGSRGAKPLTRYFPELVEAFARLLPEPCLIDGEIVVPKQIDGRERLDWDSLTQRIHPAASRVNMLSEKTPAMFIGFDLLARGDRHTEEGVNRRMPCRQTECARVAIDAVEAYRLALLEERGQDAGARAVCHHARLAIVAARGDVAERLGTRFEHADAGVF